VGGLLLAPRPAPAPAAPAPAGGPAADAPVNGPEDDRSPRVRRPDEAGSRSAPDSREPAGAETFLPPELDLADILPFTPSLGGAPAPDAPAPTEPVPAGEAVADYGGSARSPWAPVAGLAVTLAFLAIGGGFLWWRNRDTRYWPA
jgi:hypothetical protein